MKKIAFIIIAILMLDFTSAYGWGAKGHDVVAAIAEQHLTPKAKRKINRILDGKSIVYYSSWMDNIQNSPYWENGYNKTKTWHYANVDEGFTYQTMTKNPDGDVVSGLEMLTKEMTENYRNLTDSMRVDYLKMIVHMVGDLHCPMHAGRLSDRGGNGTEHQPPLSMGQQDDRLCKKMELLGMGRTAGQNRQKIQKGNHEGII